VTLPERWRLNRGGIVNIWQYDQQIFDFSGGRAVFQGTNGSGKSRTLELLLPLCLDGDLRHLGSKGFDTVSIRRLMLDDYDAGPNRIGYAWIELRRTGPDGQDEYLTCGVGVKASRTSQQVTDSWRFVTPARVKHDFDLVDPGDVPLGPAQLREAIGADCVLEEAVFRARVAETVYGMPASRYGDLLHLQRTLRNPDVGLKVLEGQLEQILSDALPPLDPHVVEQLAGSFEDLESIRENIARLSAADTAMRAFLDTYRGYALRALRDAGKQVTESRQALEKLHRELEQLERQLAEAREERRRAETEVARMEAAEDELGTRIETLRALPGYRELQDLRDRERIVAGARNAAEVTLDAATRQRAQEDRAVDTVLQTLHRLRQDGADAARLAEQLRRDLVTAGLDGSLVPTPPALPAAEPVVVTDQVRAKPDPDAAPLVVERRRPPRMDVDTLLEALRDAAAQAEAAMTVARQREAVTEALHERAVTLDRQRSRVEDLQRQAREAQIAATDAAARRNQARQELGDAAALWLEQVVRWSDNVPFVVTAPHGAPTDRPQFPPVEALVADRRASKAVRDALRHWIDPHQKEADRRALVAEQQVREIGTALRARETELAELRRGTSREPDRPPLSTAERDPSQGSAFHRLVDFAPGLDDAERAGLEAALQGSGLLNAWVRADGVPEEPGLAEVLAHPADAVPGRTLADLLVPAPEPGCPVPTTVIDRILAAVPVTDDPDAADTTGLVLTTTGRWRAGVLVGAWHKDTAEYVGAGARETARRRRIAELEDELEQLRGELSRAQEHLERARREAEELRRYLDTLPDDGDLIAAHTTLGNAENTVAEAERQARALREEHTQAQRQWTAAHGELLHATAEVGLPADSEKLAAARKAAERARDTAERLRDALGERCHGIVTTLIGMLEHHGAAEADRIEAESVAETACAEYAEQARTLEELSAAIDGEARQIAAQIAELEAERRRLRRDLPEARERVTGIRERISRAETQLGTKQNQLAGRQHDHRAAVAAFRRALAAPGVWAAALPAPEPTEEPDEAWVPTGPPDDVDTALAALAAAEEQRAANKTTVINRLQALQQALSGAYDITADEHAGIITVTVTGEEGPRPVAETARRVAERLAQQRSYLGERYQEIFATYLIRDLAERLRGQIAVAEDLCRRMNEVLERAQSSQGVHVQLEWRPSAALDESTRQALELVRTPFANRTPEQDLTLRRVFTERIEAEREVGSGGYAEILARALDYRNWYSFTVRVRDTGPDGKPRVRRLRQLSSGETRLVSYVTLFAAAASFYDAVSGTTTGNGGRGAVAPLRLVLLDEAFERLDDPTIARMLGLLVDLDMDWIITWPSGWGVSPKIPRMHIYDVLRPRSGKGVACTHTVWNGRGLEHENL